MIPTTTDVKAIGDKVRAKLVEAEREGIFLKVTGERFEDDWLYVIVEPSRTGVRGVRAIDHSDRMAEIERELRRQGDDNVLLVPVLED